LDVPPVLYTSVPFSFTELAVHIFAILSETGATLGLQENITKTPKVIIVENSNLLFIIKLFSL
jgi:hypothetical protein